MKARGCGLTGRLVLELAWSVAFLVTLTAAAGLAQADGGATAVAEPPPAAAAKPATEPAAPPAPPAAEAAPAEAKPADVKPAEAKPSDAEAARAEKRKEAEAKAKAEAAKLQVQLVTLGGTYEDIVGANEFDPTSLIIGGSPGKRRNFYKLCELLEETAKNPKINAVVFDLSDADLGLNLAQLDELLRRLSSLRKSGKKVGAWLESAESAHLAVAAGCDHVAMADLGGVDMPSKTMQSYFYRDAMDLLGLKASVVRPRPRAIIDTWASCMLVSISR